MAACESFAEFVHFVLSAEEILYDDAGDSESRRVTRRSFRERLNPLEHFSDLEFPVRCRFTKATGEHSAVSARSASTRSLPPSTMLQLLVVLSFYGARTFQVVTGTM
ncbi:hypothetical protein ISCGN_001797 [Ixodes scapularis]